MEKMIAFEEHSRCFKNTILLLGSSRFLETFYRVILGVVHQFLKETQLPVTRSFDILGLTSKELKDKK